MKRVLHVTSSLDGGGIASLLYDYCSRMLDDFCFDIVVTADSKGMLEEKFEKIGCKIYHIHQFRKSPFKHLKELKNIIKNGDYDIVHDHSNYKSLFSLRYAKKYKVKKRIAHTHVAHDNERRFTRLEKFVCTPLVKHYATNLFACSKDAAIWSWGKGFFRGSRNFIMRNSICINSFLFDQEKRIYYRNDLNLNGSFVVGNVARFTSQKNHLFTIDVFNEMTKICSNVKLVLVGDGPLMKNVRDKVADLKLEDKVLFLGVRGDVPQLINAFDCFVVPSVFEGLGIVFVESQANGLSTFTTLGAVPEEAKVTNYMHFIDKNRTARFWADFILNNSKVRDENLMADGSKINNYDIAVSVKALKDKYNEH